MGGCLTGRQSITAVGGSSCPRIPLCLPHLFTWMANPFSQTASYRLPLGKYRVPSPWNMPSFISPTYLVSVGRMYSALPSILQGHRKITEPCRKLVPDFARNHLSNTLSKTQIFVLFPSEMLCNRGAEFSLFLLPSPTGCLGVHVVHWNTFLLAPKRVGMYPKPHHRNWNEG